MTKKMKESIIFNNEEEYQLWENKNSSLIVDEYEQQNISRVFGKDKTIIKVFYHKSLSAEMHKLLLNYVREITPEVNDYVTANIREKEFGFPTSKFSVKFDNKVYFAEAKAVWGDYKDNEEGAIELLTEIIIKKYAQEFFNEN